MNGCVNGWGRAWGVRPMRTPALRKHYSACFTFRLRPRARSDT